MEQWQKLKERKGLTSANPYHLELALMYLNKQAARVEKIEYKKTESPKIVKETKDNDEELSPLAISLIVAVGLLIASTIVVYFITHPKVFLAVASVPLLLYGLFKLLESFAGLFARIAERLERIIPSEHKFRLLTFGYIMIILSTPLLFFSGEEIFHIYNFTILIAVVASFFGLESHRVFAPVYGDPNWLYSLNKEKIESERMAIMTALSEKHTEHGSPVDSQKSEEDPDISPSDTTVLPAPPGITEIVMDNSEQETFSAMRQHLVSVRNYHRIVHWSLIVAFLTFFAVSVYKFLSPSITTGDYIKAFGSAGVGGALMWFGTRVLWANRVSQLSLALFESHVQEVHSSLQELPKVLSSEERRSLRSRIWTSFRSGLNTIWLSENELLAQKNNKNGSGDAEQG